MEAMNIWNKTETVKPKDDTYIIAKKGTQLKKMYYTSGRFYTASGEIPCSIYPDPEEWIYYPEEPEPKKVPVQRAAIEWHNPEHEIPNNSRNILVMFYGGEMAITNYREGHIDQLSAIKGVKAWADIPDTSTIKDI